MNKFVWTKLPIFKYVLIASLLQTINLFAQTNNPGLLTKSDDPKELAEIRVLQMRADIEKEIGLLDTKFQIILKAKLGDTYLDEGYLKSESYQVGLALLKKAVELALAPTTKYSSNHEKISTLWNLYREVFMKEKDLESRLRAAIKELLLAETGNAKTEICGRQSIYMAFFWADLADDLSFPAEKNKFNALASEYAMFSLDCKVPAVSFHSFEYFNKIRKTNPELADKYFEKLIKTVQNSGNIGLLIEFIKSANANFFSPGSREYFSDSQKKVVFPILLPYLQQEADELTKNVRQDCRLTRLFAVTFLQDYKRILPNEVNKLENLINVCQNSPIEFWKKPDFIEIKKRTAEEELELANKTTDSKKRISFLLSASFSASMSGNFSKSIEILDAMPEESKDEHWRSRRIDSVSKLISQLFWQSKFTEASQILKKLPANQSPFVILAFFENYNNFSLFKNINEAQKAYLLEMLNTAKSEFEKAEVFPAEIAEYSQYPSINPTDFGKLTEKYIDLGFYDEALASHISSIKTLNRLIKTLPARYREENYEIEVGSNSDFLDGPWYKDQDFIDKNFDKIYQNLGEIEFLPIKVRERLNFLDRFAKNTRFRRW